MISEYAQEYLLLLANMKILTTIGNIILEEEKAEKVDHTFKRKTWSELPEYARIAYKLKAKRFIKILKKAQAICDRQH